MTAAAETTTIALPPYNAGWDYDTARLDEATAQAIAERVLELGADHGFSQEGRAPTEEEQTAFREGRLTGYHKDKPRDRHDRLIHIYTRGPVEQAFEEAGFDPKAHKDRRLVDHFLKAHRDEKLASLEALRAKERAEAINAFLAAHPQTPGAERLIREACAYGAKGGHAPELMVFDWADRLSRVTNPYGGKTTAVAPYAPEPSGYKLRIHEAVSLSYRQEAYADYSTYLIPVTVEEPKDRNAALRNLRQIAVKLGTHNGWAGSGSTHDFTLVDGDDDGCFVVMVSRHSISD